MVINLTAFITMKAPTHSFAVRPEQGFEVHVLNADSDALNLAAEQNHCGVVAAGDFTTWQIRLRLGT